MKDETQGTRFYLTPAHPCSYLPDREAQTMFLDPRERTSTRLYSELTQMGFRRSGGHLYRPRCNGCQACIPTRLPVAEFAPRRAQRRTLKRNQDLELQLTSAQFTPEVFALYERYIAARHQDGDMYPADADQFKSFLLCNWSETYFLGARLDGRLVAVAVMDRLEDGLSAIYTFFDTSMPDRSLGRQMILEQIQLCKNTNLTYLYLGYWIEASPKMRYKADFQPVETFVDGRWTRLLARDGS